MLKKAWEMFRKSAGELRKTRTIVLVGLFAALQIVVKMFALQPLPWLRVTFGFVFLAASGMLFGPVVAGMQGAVADVIGFLLRPTGAFSPGLTVSALLTGMLFGCFFYRARVGWARALLAKATVSVLISIGLNTLWLSMMYGKAFLALLPERALTSLALLPIEVPLLVLTYQLLQRLQKRSA